MENALCLNMQNRQILYCIHKNSLDSLKAGALNTWTLSQSNRLRQLMASNKRQCASLCLQRSCEVLWSCPNKCAQKLLLLLFQSYIVTSSLRWSSIKAERGTTLSNRRKKLNVEYSFLFSVLIWAGKHHIMGHNFTPTWLGESRKREKASKNTSPELE